MRLAISNLAWDDSCNDEIIKLLPSLSVSGVEVAPTKIASWDNLSNQKLLEFKCYLNDHSLEISSLQAIFFGIPDAHLLGSQSSFENLVSHIDKVADIASLLGAEVAVFGAPKNRLRGDLSSEDAFKLGVDRFRQIGEICAGRMVIGIEPVPQYYGSDFILTAGEDLDIVNAVNHPFIGLHLDTGCVLLGGGNIYDAIVSGKDRLVHFHAAEPDLADFSNIQSEHTIAAKALLEANYDRWVSIEMKQTANPIASVKQAVNFTRDTYNIN